MKLTQIVNSVISVFKILIFRSRKKFSTTYAIKTFFFFRPFNQNCKILENCLYYFQKTSQHIHSTSKRAPVCAMTSKSYDWDVRNIAKISPKMFKNSDIWTIFISQKLFIRFEQIFLHSFYTTLGGAFNCAIWAILTGALLNKALLAGNHLGQVDWFTVFWSIKVFNCVVFRLRN